MNPALVTVAGLVLFILAVAAMAYCASHDAFGTMVDGMPHWSNYAAGATWIAIVAGAAVTALGLSLLYAGATP